MAQEKYIFYTSKILSGEDPLAVIKQAREDYGLTTNFSFDLNYTGRDIPFNIEREYLTSLIEDKKYTNAKRFIENMKKTYTRPEEHNFIEVYEYHLHAVMQSEKTNQQSILEAKKEFNTHTITLTGIIVGVVTILGTANQTFNANSFQDGMNTFWSISLAVIFLVIIAFLANSFSRKK